MTSYIGLAQIAQDRRDALVAAATVERLRRELRSTEQPRHTGSRLLQRLQVLLARQRAQPA